MRRGSHVGSFETAHALTRGETWNAPEEPEEGAEEYDLIVVGAGVSGLSAAHLYRKWL
jgi:spermidine dehydrogenase